MAIDPSAVWDFAKEVVGAARPDRGRTTATVTRIDADGTTWVTTGDGGEAPAGSAAAGVSVGDTVTLEWDGSAMGIRGNVSNPSPAGSVVRRAVARAQGVADAAQRVADAVNQHFFADGHGIHVTEATQEEWDESHSGANVLINSVGQLFRDGLVNLLTLTTESGARALTVWDGLGNTTSHIRATIGEVITLGPVGSVQMILSSTGLEVDNESGDEIFAIESSSTGSVTITLDATLVTWNATADVGTTAYMVRDSGAAAGDVAVAATVGGIDYALDSTYATATVTAGTGVVVALTSTGVTYVQGIMADVEVTTGELSVEYQHAVTDIALLSLIGQQAIDGEGESLQITNSKWVSNSRQSSTLIRLHNATTGRGIKLGVGSNGYVRGLWDSRKNDWVIARSVDDKTVINGPNFSVSNTGSVSTGPTVVAKGINRVALYSSTTSGDMGLRDMTNNRWIIYRHHDYGIVLGNSASDSLYHRTSTCTVNTATVTQSGDNHCWNNGAVCSFVYRCAVKSALANGSELAVGTLPANYRPPYEMAVEVYTSTAVCVNAKVGTDGTITVRNVSGSSLATSVLLRISGTFAL